jgi:hypothetical protein
MTHGTFTEHVIGRLHLPLDRPYDDAVADFERVVPPEENPHDTVALIKQFLHAAG